MANARTYSIVLFGATGVTGYGVAEHLAERLKGDPAVKWAIAGRNEAKMLRTKQSLGDAGKNVGILVADSNDFAALVDVAKATRVVISCVGPFMLHGKPLVQACTTGEPPFIRDLLSLHEQAEKDGTFIVPACGFDCVPSDLGAFAMIKSLRDSGFANVGKIHLALTKASGTVSGGTLHSVLGIMDLPAKQKFQMSNPHYLIEGKIESKPARDTVFEWNKDLARWQGYYIMSGVNVKVVNRSASLLRFGPNFSYSEGTSFKSFIKVLAYTIALGTIGILVMLPPVRWLIRWAFPQTMERPSSEKLKSGFFKMCVTGEATNSAGRTMKRKLVLTAKGDPGYEFTCKATAECALLLVKNQSSLGKGNVFPPVKGGILTPASAFRTLLLDSLKKHADFDLYFPPLSKKDD